MTSPVFALYITCLFLGKTAQTKNLELSRSDQPEHRFVSVKTGETLMLHCSYEGNNAEWFYWYKQSLGKKPRLIAGYSKHQTKANFYHEFTGNPRFTMDMEDTKSNLTITNVHISDSATYYCAGNYPAIFEFVEVITVSVEGSAVTVPALVHQSTSGSIQSGDSVTLNCTVHTGTYYCAVASCGHILFGNGTKLHFKDDRVLVNFLSSALAFTTILVIILAFSVYRINKRSSSQSPETQASLSTASTENTEGNADNLHYAALDVKKPNRSRRQSNSTNNECLYSGVKV